MTNLLIFIIIVERLCYTKEKKSKHEVRVRTIAICTYIECNKVKECKENEALKIALCTWVSFTIMPLCEICLKYTL